MPERVARDTETGTRKNTDWGVAGKGNHLRGVYDREGGVVPCDGETKGLLSHDHLTLIHIIIINILYIHHNIDTEQYGYKMTRLMRAQKAS